MENETSYTPEYRKRQAAYIVGICIFSYIAQSMSIYESTYFKEVVGFTATTQGFMSSVTGIVAIVAVSFWGIISDRAGTLKKVLIPVTITSSLIFFILPFVPTNTKNRYILFIAIAALIQFFWTPMMSLTENTLVRNCAELDINYGHNRAIASLTYSLGSIAAAQIVLPLFGIRATFWGVALFNVPTLILFFLIRDAAYVSKKAQKSVNRMADFKALMSNHKYVLFLIAVLCFSVASAGRMNFLPYFMSTIGVSTDRIGFLMGFAAFMEIPMMFFLTKIHERLSYRSMIMVALTMQAVCVLLMATICSNFATLLFCFVFQGAGNGLFLASTYNYIYEVAPASLKATAQAIYSVTGSTARIVGSAVGGMVFEAVGARSFYGVMFVFQILAILILFIPKLIERRRRI